MGCRPDAGTPRQFTPTLHFHAELLKDGTTARCAAAARLVRGPRALASAERRAPRPCCRRGLLGALATWPSQGGWRRYLGLPKKPMIELWPALSYWSVR